MSAGSWARRPPSSSRKLSGTRSACPGVGLVSVRTSSRPSSSAKNGLPAVASCTRPSSGRDSSSPSRCLSRLCVALSLSGPTESCCRRPSAKARSSSKGLAASGVFRRVARSPTRSALSRRSAIWITPAEAGSSHCRSSRATTTAPRSAQSTQDIEHPQPYRVWVWRDIPRLGEQERDFERPSPRRHERMRRFVEHRGNQL